MLAPNSGRVIAVAATRHAHSLAQDQTLTLSDGRTLAFAEYGPSSGTQVFFLHGYPSSRLEPFGLEPQAEKRNLRLIAPDRPGYGLSSPQPGRTIPNYNSDLKALVEHLQVDSFGVLGHSGGGPYAIGSALAFPPTRLKSIGVMSGGPPWESSPGVRIPLESRTPDMSLSRRVLSRLSVSAPGPTALLMDGLVGALRAASRTRFVTSRVDAWLEGDKALQAEDPDAEDKLSTTEKRDKVIRVVFEGFAQGSSAAVVEARLLSHYWDFDFEDITHHIRIWHGANDSNAPIKMMRYMAGRLPKCTLKEFDETHYTVDKHMDEILDDFCAPLHASTP